MQMTRWSIDREVKSQNVFEKEDCTWEIGNPYSYIIHKHLKGMETELVGGLFSKHLG